MSYQPCVVTHLEQHTTNYPVEIKSTTLEEGSLHAWASSVRLGWRYLGSRAYGVVKSRLFRSQDQHFFGGFASCELSMQLKFHRLSNFPVIVFACP